MLSKEQLLDIVEPSNEDYPSNCPQCDSKLCEDCVVDITKRALKSSEDFVINIAKTALELLDKVEKLEAEKKHWKEMYEGLDAYVKRKYKDF